MKKLVLLVAMVGLPVQCGMWQLVPLGGITALAVPVVLIRRKCA